MDIKALEPHWEEFWSKKPPHLSFDKKVVSLFYTAGAIALATEIFKILSDDSISTEEASSKLETILKDVAFDIEKLNNST